jgi:hypothetical protein
MRAFIIVLLCISSIYQANETVRNQIFDFMMEQPTKNAFKIFHYLYKKPYDLNTEEGLTRYRNFKSNFKLIKETNAKKLEYTLGLNPFADMTQEEIRSKYLTLGNEKEDIEIDNEEIQISKDKEISFDNFVDEDELPDKRNLQQIVSKDWSHLWNAARVQGICGSCWAFATVAVIEGRYKQKYDAFPVFSKQQLVDCVKGCSGCEGGSYRRAFPYAESQGIVLESQYTYQEKDGVCRMWDKKCKKTYSTSVKIKGYKFCNNDDEKYPCTMSFYDELIKEGPIAAAIDSDTIGFYFYRDGIYTPESCVKRNHAIVIVEINTVKGYVKIRNSWESWGDSLSHGKIKIVNIGNMKACGLFEQAFQPIDIIKQ